MALINFRLRAYFNGLCDLFQGLRYEERRKFSLKNLFYVGPVFYPAELDPLFYHKRIKIESKKRK